MNVPDTIDLSEVGALSAKVAEFLNVKATSVKIGTTSLTLSNNQVFFTDGATSNMIMGSNSITVLNSQPFTISNANVITNCNISAPSFTEGGTALGTKYSLSNQPTRLWALSNTSVYTYSNVGIGTSNPAYQVDVNGTVNATLFNLNGYDKFIHSFIHCYTCSSST